MDGLLKPIARKYPWDGCGYFLEQCNIHIVLFQKKCDPVTHPTGNFNYSFWFEDLGFSKYLFCLDQNLPWSCNGWVLEWHIPLTVIGQLFWTGELDIVVANQHTIYLNISILLETLLRKYACWLVKNCFCNSMEIQN